MECLCWKGAFLIRLSLFLPFSLCVVSDCSMFMANGKLYSLSPSSSSSFVCSHTLMLVITLKRAWMRSIFRFFALAHFDTMYFWWWFRWTRTASVKSCAMFQATATNNDPDDRSIHANAIVVRIRIFKHKIFVLRLVNVFFFSFHLLNNFKMLLRKVMVLLFEWDIQLKIYHKNYHRQQSLNNGSCPFAMYAFGLNAKLTPVLYFFWFSSLSLSFCCQSFSSSTRFHPLFPLCAMCVSSYATYVCCIDKFCILPINLCAAADLLYRIHIPNHFPNFVYIWLSVRMCCYIYNWAQWL